MRGGRWWVPWLLSSALLSLFSPDCSADVVLTDQEATELDDILTTLERRSIEREAMLRESARLLDDLQTQLATTRDSLAAAAISSEEREAELRRMTAERDAWRVTAAATGVAGLVAVIIVLVLRR